MARMHARTTFPEKTDPQEGADCPWADLSPDGHGLSVHDFLTTVFSRAGSELRRTITGTYVGRFGLTVSEWRVLSVLAHAGEMPFADLVEQAVADKAQVSRTLQLLGGRGLVETEALGTARRHGTVCRMTDAGWALYEQVMPEAQRSQAAMILTLVADERRMLYSILRKLHDQCVAAGATDPD